MARTIHEDVIGRVLLKSKRRCCLCHALQGDSSPKIGQLAHLDRDPSNSSEENLVFLCLSHHSEIDSKTAQRRGGYTQSEIKRARDRMYSQIQSPEVDHTPEPYGEYRAFERQAQGFLANMFGTTGFSPRITSNSRVRGKSGHEYEIDIIVEVNTAGLRILIIAECKATKRPVGPDTVLDLYAKVQDIGAHKGLVISKAGFSLSAIHVAKANGIALLTVAKDSQAIVSE